MIPVSWKKPLRLKEGEEVTELGFAPCFLTPVQCLPTNPSTPAVCVDVTVLRMFSSSPALGRASPVSGPQCLWQA